MLTYNEILDGFEGSDDVDDDDETNNGDTIQTIEDLIDNAETDEDSEEPTADELCEEFIGLQRHLGGCVEFGRPGSGRDAGVLCARLFLNLPCAFASEQYRGQISLCAFTCCGILDSREALCHRYHEKRCLCRPRLPGFNSRSFCQSRTARFRDLYCR